MGVKLEELVTKTKAENDSLMDTSMDIVNFREDIKLYQSENFFMDRYSQQMRSFRTADLKLYFNERVVWAVEIVCYEVFHIVSFIAGAYFAFIGKSGVGFVVGVMLLNGYLMEILSSMPAIYSDFKKHMVSVDRYLQIVNETPKVGQSPSAFIPEESGKANVDILVKQLSYEIEDKKILDNVNLSIQGGEKVLILGESGCGKSTLLKLLSGYSSCYKGSILVEGADLKSKDFDYLAGNISFVPQEIMLVNDSILNNMRLFTNCNEVSQVVQQSEGMKSAFEDILQQSKGLELKVDMDSKNLSKGQFQRIGFIIGLIKKNRLLLVDEGFSSLDPENTNKMLKLIDKYRGTLVFASHVVNEEVLKRFDKVIILDEGKVIVTVRADEFMRNHTLKTFIHSEKGA